MQKNRKSQYFVYQVLLKIGKEFGTNALIKKGAILAQTPSDVLEKYGIDKIKNIEIKSRDYKESKKQDYTNIKKEYREIYMILNETLSAEEISIKTKMNITEVYEKLFLMELEGLIKKEGNKYKIRNEE